MGTNHSTMASSSSANKSTNEAEDSQMLSIPFKEAFDFEERLAESSKMRKRYDNRIPVIAEPIDGNAPSITQKKCALFRVVALPYPFAAGFCFRPTLPSASALQCFGEELPSHQSRCASHRHLLMLGSDGWCVGHIYFC